VPDEAALAPEVVDRLRAICLALPEAYEERAWVGVRWMVRKRTFAHLIPIDEDSPPALIKVRAVTALPVTVVTFRSVGQELRALRASGHPFFYAGWGRDVLAMVIDDATDWDEVQELLTESYCVLAPQKLQALVDRPEP
jgi:hypothetical protein